MKKYILSLCTFIFLCTVNAQINNYKITYRHCFQYDTTLKLRDTLGFQAILLGNSVESNYSFAKAFSNVTNEKTFDEILKDKQAGTFKVKTGYSSDSIGNNVYCNRTTDSIYVREKMINEYVVTEEMKPKINWIITGEKMKIKEYSCIKATTYFRGRHYKAWFTTDVAIVAAPWKFYGLPGLLMLIEDDKMQVKIYVEKIEFPVKETVPRFVESGKKITLEKYFTFRNEEFIRNSIAIQTMLDNQDNMQAIINSGEARPVVKMKGAPYSIEIRLD